MNDYELETDEYLRHGVTVFQCRLFGATESEHLDNYAAWLRPSGVVVDMGAGVGATGFGLQLRCPAVSEVINVTNSAVQAKYISAAGGQVICCDYHSVPEVKDASADFVMFNETLGYGDLKVLMHEASRMLRPLGRLVVKDFVPKTPLAHTDLVGWEYKVAPMHIVVAEAAENGLRCIAFAIPAVSSGVWEKFMQASRMPQWHGTVEYPLDSAFFVFEKSVS